MDIHVYIVKLSFKEKQFVFIIFSLLVLLAQKENYRINSMVAWIKWKFLRKIFNINGVNWSFKRCHYGTSNYSMVIIKSFGFTTRKSRKTFIIFKHIIIILWNSLYFLSKNERQTLDIEIDFNTKISATKIVANNNKKSTTPVLVQMFMLASRLVKFQTHRGH